MSISSFAQPLLADVDERTKKQLKTVLSVDSNYFWLRSDITVNEIELTMNSVNCPHGPTTLFLGSLASDRRK